MALPLRYQLAIVLVGLNVAATSALAVFAYKTSRQTLDDQARLAVASVVEARQQALHRMLVWRQERLQGFLASVESLCGERGARGTYGFESECVRVALTGLRDEEGATAVDLRYRQRRLASRGAWGASSPAPAKGQLAVMDAADWAGEYAMVAAHGLLSIRARFPRSDFDPIFVDRSGLRKGGEAFLLDAAGAFLTTPRYQTPPPTVAAQSGVISQCLAGANGQVIGRDYRGEMVITGFQPAVTAGGGCVVANLPYAEVLVPINRLGRTFVYGAAAFLLLSVLLSFLLSHAVAKPIARLANSAHAMEEGRFEPPRIGRTGPREVRRLERAFSSMARSIADLIQREQRARLSAESASRLKDEFLATLSHELRTPLNAILGWSSMVAHPRADEARIRHAVRAIERNARTQARLVDDLLDVSGIINGRMRLNVVEVSLPPVVDAAIDAVRPAAEAKGIELVKRIEGPLRLVSGDSHRLQQVVWNLLSNAVRFTPDGGRIELRLRSVKDRAEIQVTDTGTGIDAEFLPHVFERFRQADSSLTRRHGGLGLGLAIVRHLVELHGGTVAVESEGEGRGATFTVLLPARGDAPVAVRPAEAPAPAPEPPLLHGARVLVVDDDPDARELLKMLLEDAGARVTTTTSAGETRAMIGPFQPDLLIADIGMPGEDGYSLLRSLRTDGSDVGSRVPAIALTAHALPEDVEKAMTAGFQMHLAKPIDPARLLSSVAAMFRPAA
ncbi:MAG TPA: ATP-binding protein [Vicinamibacterales bacterium]|jgi:signal transduction histidine kinase|nr:ATP-binding protein [Vicinamibacterales bacterium]